MARVGDIKMKLLRLIAVFVLIGLLEGLTMVTPAEAQNSFSATLTGFQVVPAISTTGAGTFSATLVGGVLNYTLTYRALRSAVQEAHIHLGQTNVNGGFFAFLCSNLANAPAGTPLCPAPPATVTGTIAPADVVATPRQGIGAGELAEAIRAMRAGVTYVDVHSAAFTAGEIRGQIRAGLGP
jgi:hypothetical protein